MRALRVGDGRSALVDVPEPRADGEVVVRVTLSGVCNTDLELERGYAGFRGTIGHELVGVAPDGTRVVGEINAGCGTCARCTAGDPRHCPTRTVLGIVGRDGAHADLVRLPARNLLAVPDGVPDRAAVFAEPLAAACAIAERVTIAGDVAVVGDGKLGLLCAFVLAARGARPVLVGKHADKLARADRRGIETTRDARGRSFDVVVEASGSAGGFAAALALVRPQGTIVLKSTIHGATPIDTTRIVVDEITIVGSRCGRLATALELLAGGFQVDDLISEIVPLGVEALRRAETPGVLKVLVDRS